MPGANVLIDAQRRHVMLASASITAVAIAGAGLTVLAATAATHEPGARLRPKDIRP